MKWSEIVRIHSRVHFVIYICKYIAFFFYMNCGYNLVILSSIAIFAMLINTQVMMLLMTLFAQISAWLIKAIFFKPGPLKPPTDQCFLKVSSSDSSLGTTSCGKVKLETNKRLFTVRAGYVHHCVITHKILLIHWELYVCVYWFLYLHVCTCNCGFLWQQLHTYIQLASHPMLIAL